MLAAMGVVMPNKSTVYWHACRLACPNPDIKEIYQNWSIHKRPPKKLCLQKYITEKVVLSRKNGLVKKGVEENILALKWLKLKLVVNLKRE